MVLINERQRRLYAKMVQQQLHTKTSLIYGKKKNGETEEVSETPCVLGWNYYHWHQKQNQPP